MLEEFLGDLFALAALVLLLAVAYSAVEDHDLKTVEDRLKLLKKTREFNRVDAEAKRR